MSNWVRAGCVTGEQMPIPPVSQVRRRIAVRLSLARPDEPEDHRLSRRMRVTISFVNYSDVGQFTSVCAALQFGNLNWELVEPDPPYVEQAAAQQVEDDETVHTG